MNDLTRSIDLNDFQDVLDDAGEFLRAWKTPDGLTVSFVDPRPVGADPALFGIALLDVIEAAAKTYARAVHISEAEATTRIWEGIASQRDQERDATQVATKTTTSSDGVVTFTQSKDR